MFGAVDSRRDETMRIILFVLLSPILTLGSSTWDEMIQTQAAAPSVVQLATLGSGVNVELRDRSHVFSVSQERLFPNRNYNYPHWFSILTDQGPRFIGTLEAVFPGATFVFIGRDMMALSIAVESFFHSIGHESRVLRIGMSKTTLESSDPSQLRDLLQSSGVDFSTLEAPHPYIFIDTISSGHGRQGRALIDAIYSFHVQRGVNPAVLLRRFNFVGLRALTTTLQMDPVEQANLLLYREERWYLQTQPTQNFGQTHHIFGYNDDRKNKLDGVSEVGFEHFTGSWHEPFGEIRFENGQSLALRGKPKSMEMRRAVAEFYLEIYRYFSDPNLFQRVAGSAEKLGHSLNRERATMPRPFVESVLMEIGNFSTVSDLQRQLNLLVSPAPSVRQEQRKLLAQLLPNVIRSSSLMPDDFDALLSWASESEWPNPEREHLAHLALNLADSGPRLTRALSVIRSLGATRGLGEAVHKALSRCADGGYDLIELAPLIADASIPETESAAILPHIVWPLQTWSDLAPFWKRLNRDNSSSARIAFERIAQFRLAELTDPDKTNETFWESVRFVFQDSFSFSFQSTVLKQVVRRMTKLSDLLALLEMVRISEPLLWEALESDVPFFSAALSQALRTQIDNEFWWDFMSSVDNHQPARVKLLQSWGRAVLFSSPSAADKLVTIQKLMTRLGNQSTKLIIEGVTPICLWEFSRFEPKQLRDFTELWLKVGCPINPLLEETLPLLTNLDDYFLYLRVLKAFQVPKLQLRATYRQLAQQEPNPWKRNSILRGIRSCFVFLKR